MTQKTTAIATTLDAVDAIVQAEEGNLAVSALLRYPDVAQANALSIHRGYAWKGEELVQKEGHTALLWFGSYRQSFVATRDEKGNATGYATRDESRRIYDCNGIVKDIEVNERTARVQDERSVVREIGLRVITAAISDTEYLLKDSTAKKSNAVPVAEYNAVTAERDALLAKLKAAGIE